MFAAGAASFTTEYGTWPSVARLVPPLAAMSNTRARVMPARYSAGTLFSQPLVVSVTVSCAPSSNPGSSAIAPRMAAQ